MTHRPEISCSYRGRATDGRVPNRFERVQSVDDLDHLADGDGELGRHEAIPTEFLPDDSRTFIRENESPDIPFRYSINPYRGCEHGCAYCYARPGHETLGMNAGIDFETKILVKYDAARLLREELGRPSWRGEMLVISGVTDCYQPIERRLGLTRACLEVIHESRQAIGIVTKNVLILRDQELLAAHAAMNLVQVSISVTTLDETLARTMEPRTAAPLARLRAIGELAAAGVPVRVMVAPIIPGLNDHEIPRILKRAKEAGARSAAYQLLRLPLSVAPVFLRWLGANYPLAQARVEGLIRQTRGGRLNQAEFGRRMRGEGAYAEGIRRSFSVFAKKYDLDSPLPALDCSRCRRTSGPHGQLLLF